MKGLAIGQYYPADSKIHRLDPRMKIMAVMLYILSLFLIKSLWVYVASAICLTFVIRISQVPVKLVVKGLRGIAYIVIFTVIINLLMTPGEHVIFEVWILSVTGEGVYMAALIGVRLILLVMGSSLLTLTTSPIQLTDGIEYLLKPLKRVGVPAHDIAMMMTIALRFIPTLIEETDKIMKAQTARGAEFDTGGVIKKAKGMIPLLVPLFISAFRRADDLALAMEARCYNGDKNRTKMKVLKMHRCDYYASAFICIYGAFLVVMRFVL